MWHEESCQNCGLQHDSAPAHTALSVQEFLAKHSISVLLQPPFLCDLSPPDIFLFPKIRMTPALKTDFKQQRTSL
jgi:hypothetical protein